MDLNYLFLRHQISLMRAAVAANPEARFAHQGLARCYAERIGALQATLGAKPVLVETA